MARACAVVTLLTAGSAAQRPQDIWEYEVKGPGQESHFDVTKMLAKESEHMSATLKRTLRAVAPDLACPESCSQQRWDQYALCDLTLSRATEAWSFGINGYDPWGEKIHKLTGLTPRTFDCYNQDKPSTFPNHFSTTCLGASGTTGDRNFTSLPCLLQKSPKGSAIVKMDIEGHEFPILKELDAWDYFGRVASLNVEYHFTPCQSHSFVTDAANLFEAIKERLSVVDASAVFFGEDCIIEGKPFPRLIVVSYVSRSICSSAVQLPREEHEPDTLSEQLCQDQQVELMAKQAQRLLESQGELRVPKWIAWLCAAALLALCCGNAGLCVKYQSLQKAANAPRPSALPDPERRSLGRSAGVE